MRFEAAVAQYILKFNYKYEYMRAKILQPCLTRFWNHEASFFFGLYLKAYSLMWNIECSQKFQHLNFSHIFVALLWKPHFPREINWIIKKIRVILTEILGHENLFNTLVYGGSKTHIIMHNLKRWYSNQLKFWKSACFVCIVSFLP